MSGHHGDCSSSPRGLYRHKENGIFLGVCAGLADRFDFSTFGVRVVTFILWMISGWVVFLLYLGAGFLLRDRPLCYGGRNERSFWSPRERNYSEYRERRYHG